MTNFPLDHIRVALYARVSTEEQRDGQTIDSQIAEATRFSQNKGWTIAGVYQDQGWSGSLLARPELDSLRDDSAKGIFDAVVVNDVDRLARDVTHLGIIKRDLEKKKVTLIFCKLPAEKSPTHNLMVNILGSFAEFEREMIADRMRRGKRHKVEVRKQFVGCTPPYGYLYVGTNEHRPNHVGLDIVPEQAAIVRQIYQWALEGVALRRIADRLDAAGISSPKRAKGWSGTTVHRIVRSEVYKGMWPYGRREACEPVKPKHAGPYRRQIKSSTRVRPRSEWIFVELPPELVIIEPAFWTKVQRRVDQNQKFSPRNSKVNYLLRGLVKCLYCGYSMCGIRRTWRTKEYLYYRCTNRKCEEGRWSSSTAVETTVWGSITKALLNPARIRTRISTAQVEMARRVESHSVPPVTTASADADIQLLEKYRSGNISGQQLADELQALRNRQREPAPIPRHKVVRSFEAACRVLTKQLENPTHETKVDIVRRIVKQVAIGGSLIRISARIEVPVGNPGDTSPRQPSAVTPRDTILAEHNCLTIEFELSSKLPPPVSNAPQRTKQRYFEEMSLFSLQAA